MVRSGLGVEAGQQFKELVSAATPNIAVHTLVPGQSVELAPD